MIDFKFEIQSRADTHIHPDFELFYILEGEADFCLEEQSFLLKKNDYLIVNSECRHSYFSEGEMLAACLYISYSELAKMLRQDILVFRCNSSLEDNEQYDHIRSILKHIFSEQFKTSGRDEIYLNSLYYNLLHEITHEFLLTEGSERYEEEKHRYSARKHAISEYVRLNYDKPVSLNALAKQLYLSDAYLSKYIRRQFGMSFLEYVNSVRLSHAMTELIYSDKSVVRIAMDTGFASSAAFSKVFKKKYGVTPSVYREQCKTKSEKPLSSPGEQAFIDEKLSAYFTEAPDYSSEGESDGHILAAVNAEDEGEVLDANWRRMINIGTAEELLDSDMQGHILHLQRELHFRYVRFWDIYSPKLFLDKHEVGKSYNFSKLDRILDFLVSHRLRPYMELGEKRKKLLKNRTQHLIDEEEEDCFSSEAERRYFYDSLAMHLLNRYGQDEVETWYFELWMSGYGLGLKTASEKRIIEIIEEYLNRFDIVAGELRSFIPGIQIGGNGTSLQFGRDFFEMYLCRWMNHEQRPDFLTVYLYPYVLEDDPKRIRNQSLDADYLKRHLKGIREVVDQVGFITRTIHVTEWNSTVSNRNVLNDGCYKGAYLLKNMIDAVGMAQIMGYWLGSDLFADYYDSGSPLNGGSGLLTKDGIAKPAYFAFDFMNRLGSLVYRRTDHYMITDYGRGHWRIVCHNYKHFNYEYCLNDEGDLDILSQNNLLSDVKRLRLSFNLPVAERGHYRLKIYSVNRDHGSVQDEWIRMEMPLEMSPEDVTYLERISIPRMVIKKVRAAGTVLSFETVLEANEIQFIHVMQVY